jgi:hypothetical protein
VVGFWKRVLGAEFKKIVVVESLVLVGDQLVLQRSAAQNARSVEAAGPTVDGERNEDAAAGRVAALRTRGRARRCLDIEGRICLRNHRRDIHAIAVVRDDRDRRLLVGVDIALKNDGAAVEDEGQIALRPNLRQQALPGVGR